MLKFDSKLKAILDESYKGADITYRRLENLRALNPKAGDRILDLGCGQGLLTEELARAVGPKGAVIGVDPSDDMRGDAEARFANVENVDIRNGYAGETPLENASLDGAISLQVFEYVEDIEGALRDLHQKLKAGGKLVIGDMHWGTFFWNSENPERTQRMCDAYEKHVVQPYVPAVLPELLSRTGFQLLETRPLTFCASDLRPDSLAFMTLHLMLAYVVQYGLISSDEAEAWVREQQQRAEEGRFFFTLTHFITVAIRR